MLSDGIIRSTSRSRRISPALKARTKSARSPILKCAARSIRLIRYRPAAPPAPRNRIRANADNRKASRTSLFERLGSQGRLRGASGGRLGNRLVNQHLPHACFRRISPQRFLVSRFVAKTRPAFRNLWRESGIQAGCCGRFAKTSAKLCLAARRRVRRARSSPNAAPHRYITDLKGGSPNAAFRRGSGPSEKVFN